MEVWLVTHTDMRRSARIRAVYDFVAKALSNDRKVLQGKGAQRPSHHQRRCGTARRAQVFFK